MSPQPDSAPDYRDFFAPRAVTADAVENLAAPASEPAADVAVSGAELVPGLAYQRELAAEVPAVDRLLALSTGEPRVDDAVSRLDDLVGLPVDDHIAVFEEVARRLHDALTGLDS